MPDTQIKVEMLVNFCELKVGQIIPLSDLGEFIFSHKEEYLKLITHIVGESNGGLFRRVYPKWFVTKEMVSPVIRQIENVLWSRNTSRGVPFYVNAFSHIPVPFAYLSSSEALAFYTDDELSNWQDSLKKKGERLPFTINVGEPVYYIRISDGACGEVKCYEGIIEAYPESQYSLFKSKEERDNEAYRMQNDMPPIDQSFLESKFTGEEIKEALGALLNTAHGKGYFDFVSSIVICLEKKAA